MLQNVQLVPSFKKPGQFDIKMNQKTTITKPVARVLFPCEPPVMKQSYNIDDIKDLNNYAKVTVKCKVLDLGPVEIRDARGTKMPLQTITVGDSTGSITLALWAKLTNSCGLGESYEYQNVTVRKYDGATSLSAGENCDIKKIMDIGQVKSTDKPAITSTLKLQITSTSCTENLQCGFCQAKITNINKELTTVKCIKCNHRQRLSALPTTVFCEVSGHYENKKITLTIADSVLQTTYGNLTADEIETKMLDTELFEFEYLTHSNKVTKILQSGTISTKSPVPPIVPVTSTITASTPADYCSV